MRWVMIPVILCLCGCGWFKNGRPMPQEGTVKEQQSIKQRQDMKAEICIEGRPTTGLQPELEMDFFDNIIKYPANSIVHAKVTNDFTKKQNDWYEMLGSFNYKSGMGQLIFWGALCIAGGAVLCYFGMWSIGVGLAIFGALLIGCGICIEKYPFIFVGVLLLGLTGVVAFVIYQVRHKRTLTDKNDLELTLTEVAAKIESLKQVDPDKVKTFITDQLAKSQNNTIIKKVISKVKGNP